ncbi:polyketide cyclase [Couchioplanes caeruleus subsp. caeruleus]|uniref:Polyketide cyclase n=1 Tax=Couchioplanes caeruleus subsp. caeruleus TaxID=56427 RepID=A0A1K0GRU7_9ACTN|nr:polyketide cyclase [Couchioplanes caeruleus subsp. caeruleus]
MRYVDAPSVVDAVVVPEPPAAVWAIVSDIALPTRFSRELQSVRWLDGAEGPTVGARFEGHNEHAMLGRWRTVSQVLACEEPSLFSWAVLDADGRYGAPQDDPAHALARWWFAVQEQGSGSRLEHGVRLGPSRSGLSLAIDQMPDREEEVVEFRLSELRAAIAATLKGIKDSLA